MKNFLKSNKNKKTALIFFVAVFFLVLDRVFKYFSLYFFLKQPLIISKYFKLDYFENKNISFSLPICPCILNILVVVMIIALLFCFVYLMLKKDFFKASILSFIIFGATSNFFDRMTYGFVIDYLNLSYFTVFNFADVSIFFGTLVFVILVYKNEKHEKAKILKD
jgi:signal peptidase II